jgi:hypothetical protein
MKFNFHFGKKKASLKTIVILTLLVAALAGIIKIEETKIWDIVYETILYFDPDSSLIPELQKDPGIIERKTERTVDKAIREVESEYDRIIEEDNKQYQPRYIEEEVKPENQTGDSSLLGGPMRLCAPWVEGC